VVFKTGEAEFRYIYIIYVFHFITKN